MHVAASDWCHAHCRVCIDRLCAHLNYNAVEMEMINVYLLSVFGMRIFVVYYMYVYVW